MKKVNSKSKKVHISSISKRKKAVIVLAAIIVGCVGAYFVFFSKAAPVTTVPAAPSIYFSPTTQELGTNSTFTVDIRVNSGATPVNVVTAYFTYPSSLVTYNSIDYATSPFTVAAEDNTATLGATPGTVKITRAIGGGVAPVSGDQLVARVTFTTKTTGGAVNLSFITGTLLANASTNLDILSGPSSLGNATYTIDTVAPSVSITSPAANAVVNYGGTTTVAVAASDATSTVSKVEFLVNGVIKNTLSAGPFNFSWNTTGLAEGSYNLTAKAYDSYNNSATSTTVVVNIKDSGAPTVSITAPTAGATGLSGAVTISANAADNSGGIGLNRVEFYVNGSLKGSDTTAPYSYAWDTKTGADGNYSLTAKAIDNAAVANSTTSAAVSVGVDNSDKTAPSAPLSLRTTANTFTSIALAWNASTDNIGVTGYQLTRNGTVVYTGASLSFNDTGLTSGTAYNYSVTATDAAGNRSVATTLSASTIALKQGDINQDNLVNALDLSALLSNWNTSNAMADINKDGIVNALDLSRLLTNWGK